MYSLVVLRRSFAHGATCRIRSDLSRSSEYFRAAKSFSPITQCNSNVRPHNVGLGLNACFSFTGYVSLRYTIRSYSSNRPNWPKRGSLYSRNLVDGLRTSGGVSQIVNHDSCSSSLHSLDCKSKTRFCRQLKRFSSTDTGPGIPKKTLIMEGTIDRFNGVRIDIEEQLKRSEIISTLTAKGTWNLKDSLLRTLSYYKAENKPAVWLEISAQCGHVIPIAAEVGFCFHHAENNHVMMYQWLGEGENRIPEYATHQVGVSGFVLDQQRQQVLMVQDRHRIARWKFPGGYSKLGEDFSETAKREVFEETGIRTEFKSILAFRQQHQMPYSFDRSDIYVVCRLEPLTFDLTVCSTELLDAKWIPLKDLFTSEVHTGLTLHVAGLAEQGLQKGFQNVDIAMSELPSVYKGMTYKLFSRPAS